MTGMWRIFICARCGREIAECKPKGATGKPVVEEIHSCAICARENK